MTFMFYIALMLTVFLVLALLIAPVILAPLPAARHILELVQSTRTDKRTVGTRERIKDTILSFANRLRSRIGFVEDDAFRQRMLAAGLSSRRSTNAYRVIRFLMPLAGAALGTVLPHHGVFMVISLGAIFYLMPDIWLRMKAKKRREKIKNGLPDALDLLVVCVEAGLGLDQAMMRVGTELIISHPEINQEFAQINLEQLAGKPRLAAWKTAALRTGVSEFSLFVTMLTQADRFGTPIVRALSRFADELRLKRRQHAEEQAAKTRIKILFPLVFFIFPCIFIVLLAPAVLDIMRNMKELK